MPPRPTLVGGAHRRCRPDLATLVGGARRRLRRLGESPRNERRKVVVLAAACVRVHVYRKIVIPRRVTKPRTCLAGCHGWSSLYGLLGFLRCIVSLMGSSPIFHWVHASTYTYTYTRPGKDGNEPNAITLAPPLSNSERRE